MAGPDAAFPFEVLYYHLDGTTHSGADAWKPLWRKLQRAGDLPSKKDPRNAPILAAIERLFSELD